VKARPAPGAGEVRGVRGPKRAHLGQHRRTVRFHACPLIGAHARIRTGDLFLTNWSSAPGEFELILALLFDFGGDHLTRA
jgi:hypothetical protein